MKATIGVYDSHEKAVIAVRELQKAGYPSAKLSIVGQAEIVAHQMRLKSTDSAFPKAEVGIGVIAGSVLGLLAGVGVFSIPGLGFLYGAGAIVGIFAGFDFGLITGGLTAILTSIGIDESYVASYQQQLEEGKFLVIAQGSDEDVHLAEYILSIHGTHMQLDTHGVTRKVAVPMAA